MSCPHAYTLTDPKTNEDPYEFYRWMLSEAPVYFDPGLNLYIVASYDLIQKVAGDMATFSNQNAQLNQWNLRPGGMPAKAMALLDAGIPQTPVLVTSDPPLHRPSRARVRMAFSVSRVERMQNYMAEVVNALVDGFIQRGAVEFVSEFAVALTVRVIADQLGVPLAEYARIKSWSDAVVGLRGLMGTDEQIIGYSEQLIDFQTYFTDLIAARRARGPAEDDMLDDLINARDDDGQPMDHPDLISTIQQLRVAGNESTTSAIASGVAIALRNPGEIPSLLADPQRMRRFVEEVLRLEPPVQGNLRRVMADVELGGVAIPKGALLQLRHAAGNRDGASFPHPNDLDLTTFPPKPHLAFGWGPHTCIGNALAREEMFVAFSILFRRLPNLRFDGDRNDFTHHLNMYIRALRSLHLAFDPQPRLNA